MSANRDCITELELGSGSDIDVNTTWAQIGRDTMMFVGARNLAYARDYVQFDMGPGRRVLRVIVQLTPADLYDIEVGRLRRRYFEWTTLLVERDIGCENLSWRIREAYRTLLT